MFQMLVLRALVVVTFVACALIGSHAEADTPNISLSQASAVAQAAKVNCNVTNTRYIGFAGLPSNIVIEISCAGDIGYIIAKQDENYSVLDCISVSQGTSCQLPENTNTTAFVLHILSSAKQPCTDIINKRYIGHTRNPTKTFVEVACPGNKGYVLGLGAGPGIYSLSGCQAMANTAFACKLTDVSMLSPSNGGSSATQSGGPDETGGATSKVGGVSDPSVEVRTIGPFKVYLHTGTESDAPLSQCLNLSTDAPRISQDRRSIFAISSCPDKVVLMGWCVEEGAMVQADLPAKGGFCSLQSNGTIDMWGGTRAPYRPAPMPSDTIVDLHRATVHIVGCVEDKHSADGGIPSVYPANGGYTTKCNTANKRKP